MGYHDQFTRLTQLFRDQRDDTLTGQNSALTKQDMLVRFVLGSAQEDVYAIGDFKQTAKLRNTAVILQFAHALERTRRLDPAQLKERFCSSSSLLRYQDRLDDQTWASL